MIGTTLSHYRIMQRLAAGGMGVVYLAHDERLERDVALKMLPEGALSEDDARARFRNEARALSRLSHAHIATVYDFDSVEGRDFLVMEYVTGVTLAERIAAGPIEEGEVLTIGAQIADALEAAHDQGVIHRDLKPGNVMVTPRRGVKVLDFGIAKLLRADGARAVTHSSGTPSVRGTLAYMAPEQLLGAAVDERSDVYALGVVLYEMAASKHPHADQATEEMMYAIIHTRPVPPRRIRPAVSWRLEAVILRALEKSPERRQRSARQLAEELRAAAAGGSPAGGAEDRARIEAIAVLPLANLSGDAAQEFFADGMTEALIASLAQIRALRVISRTSAMRYKDANLPLPEIARALNVDAIVEGGVLRSGDRVRVTANLIESATDRHLWSKSYERDVGDVLTLQADVARAIAEEIRVEITPREHRRLATGRAVDPRAFEAYLKGRHAWNKRTPQELRRGVEFFQQAIDADPTYAEAYAGLADSYNLLGETGEMRADGAFAIARAAVMHALEIDDQLAEAHTSLGFLKTYQDWDWSGAEAEYMRAIALNPGYATGHQWYAEFLNAQGRMEEALFESRRALQLDPLAFILGTTLGDTFFFARRYDEAIAQLRATIGLAPNFAPAHSDLGRVLAQSGRYDEAIEHFQTAIQLAAGNPKLSAGLAQAYGLAGRRDEALPILARLESRAGDGLVSMHAIGAIYVTLGEHEIALTWLERAVAAHDRALVWAKVHPRLDPLRGDPRFVELLRRMKLDS